MPSSASFRSRYLRTALLVVPVAYFSIPFSVLVHEVAGHGLVAILLGGTFRDFVVAPFGTGAAWAEAPGREVLSTSAGSAADAVTGTLLFLRAAWLPRGSGPRLALLLLSAAILPHPAMALLLGGVLRPDAGGGDFADVTSSLGEPGLAALVAVVGAVAFLALSWGFGRLLLREAEHAFGRDARRRDGKRAALSALLVLLPGVLWLLIPLAAHLPYPEIFKVEMILWPFTAAFLVQVAVAIGAWALPDATDRGPAPPPPGWVLIAFAWVLALGLFLVTYLWWGLFPWER